MELETIWILFVIAALKRFDIVADDVASAYIQVMVGEKVYTISGQEFIPWKLNTLIIVKALYGLKSSSFMWHHKFFENIRDMGFHPCYADFDLWIRDRGNYYE